MKRIMVIAVLMLLTIGAVTAENTKRLINVKVQLIEKKWVVKDGELQLKPQKTTAAPELTTFAGEQASIKSVSQVSFSTKFFASSSTNKVRTHVPSFEEGVKMVITPDFDKDGNLTLQGKVTNTKFVSQKKDGEDEYLLTESKSVAFKTKKEKGQASKSITLEDGKDVLEVVIFAKEVAPPKKTKSEAPGFDF